MSVCIFVVYVIQYVYCSASQTYAMALEKSSSNKSFFYIWLILVKARHNKPHQRLHGGSHMLRVTKLSTFPLSCDQCSILKPAYTITLLSLEETGGI